MNVIPVNKNTGTDQDHISMETDSSRSTDGDIPQMLQTVDQGDDRSVGDPEAQIGFTEESRDNGQTNETDGNPEHSPLKEENGNDPEVPSVKNSYDYDSDIKAKNYYSGKALDTFYIPWDTTGKVGAEMGVGAMFHIVPDVRPTNALASFTFTSSNEDVAAVDAYGMVYGVGEGQTTITVKSNNGISKSYTVTVEGDGGVKHLTSAPDAPVLIRGDADGNGAVESIDVAVIQRRLAYIDVPVDDVTLMRGNVNGDEQLDIIDVTAIQRYLANQSNPYDIGARI